MTTTNPFSTHDPDAPIALVDNDAISLITRLREIALVKPAWKKGLIYVDWIANVHPAELLFMVGKDAESGNFSLNEPVMYSGSPSMQCNGGICFYHDGTPDDVWKQLTKSLISIAGVARIELPDTTPFLQFCVLCAYLDCDQFLPKESFAEVAARLDEEEKHESKGVSQNDLSIPPAPFPPAPDTATG